MNYLISTVLLSTLLLTCSCAILSQRDKVDRFVKLSGVSSLSEETYQQLELHLSRTKDGIHRVVVPLKPEEAVALHNANIPGHWTPGPIPDSIWKGTVQMGDTREPPDKFIPVYTNKLEYIYREAGAHFHLYVLDSTSSQAPVLYYVYFNLH